MSFRTRFSSRISPQINCTMEERKTKSEFADDCDINKIMSRYRKTGILPDSSKAALAQYGNFDQIPSFHEMQDKVLAAHELFSSLPAHVRKEFDNDPGLFIDSSQTAEGMALMVKLGLATVRSNAPINVPDDTPKGKGAKNSEKGSDGN